MPEKEAAGVQAPVAEETIAEAEITYYPEEGAEAEAPKEEIVETAGEKTPLELEAQAPSLEVPAPAVVPPPVAPPKPITTELADTARFERLVQEQQVLIQQAQAELVQLKEAEEDRELRASWENQGYTGEQIQAGLQNRKEQRLGLRNLQQRQQALEAAYQQKEAVLQAKVQVITKLSEEYDVPFPELMKWSQEPGQDNPYVLAAKAEAHQLKQQLAQAKQAKVAPVKMASAGAGQTGTTSRERIREAYIRGEPLTPEQEKILFPARV